MKLPEKQNKTTTKPPRTVYKFDIRITTILGRQYSIVSLICLGTESMKSQILLENIKKNDRIMVEGNLGNRKLLEFNKNINYKALVTVLRKILVISVR